jgi:hypothetical protein
MLSLASGIEHRGGIFRGASPAPSVESLSARAEEEPAVVAAVEALGTPPLPVPPAAVEEGQIAAGATAPQAALEPPAEADPSGGDVLVVLDEDSVPLPLLRGCDIVMAPMSEPAPVVVTVDPFPVVEVPEPSPASEVPDPSSTAEAAETSSAAGVITVEEVMELGSWRHAGTSTSPALGLLTLKTPNS